MSKCDVTMQLHLRQEKVEDTKGVIRIRKAKKARQYNCKKKKDKKTHSDLQNTTEKTKERTARTH